MIFKCTTRCLSITGAAWWTYEHTTNYWIKAISQTRIRSGTGWQINNTSAAYNGINEVILATILAPKWDCISNKFFPGTDFCETLPQIKIVSRAETYDIYSLKALSCKNYYMLHRNSIDYKRNVSFWSNSVAQRSFKAGNESIGDLQLFLLFVLSELGSEKYHNPAGEL